MNKYAGRYDDMQLRNVLNSLSDFAPEVHETSGTGSATELAKEVEDESYLIVYGGDGTINEVTQSIVNRNVVMVPYSGGTGSDFQKTIGILELSQIARAIGDGLSSRVDAARVSFQDGTRYFLNIMEIGLGAIVMKRVNKRDKTYLDPFTSAVLHEISRVENYRLKIEAEGYSAEISSPEIVIANGKYFGGGMLASPDSKLGDGKLDIHAIRAMKKVKLMLNLRKLRNGKYIDLPEVINFSAGWIDVRGDTAPVEMDGEVVGSAPLRVEVAEKSVGVLGKFTLANS